MSAEVSANLEKLVSRLEAVTTRLEAIPSGRGGGAQGSEENPVFVDDMIQVENGKLGQFLGCCDKIGEDVKTAGEMLKKLVEKHREFLIKVGKCKKPSQDELQQALKPLADVIAEIQAFRDKNRTSKYFNHLSTLSEGVPAFGWVSVSPTPRPYVQQMQESAQFYSNKVLKDYRGKDELHVEWVQSWNGFLKELMEYIKQHFTTGITWNDKGVDIKSFKSGAAPSPSGGAAPPPPPPPAGGAPPPPPPPGPPPPVDTAPAPAGDTAPATAALFASINKGADITKGLKKVTDDMKTHKNPNLKFQAPQPYKASPPTAPKPFKAFSASKASTPPKKPPKLELDGKKWIVENQENESSLVISDTLTKHTVYIFNCKNSTIQIKGKVNSITMDSCKKCGVVFEDVISSMEFINCQSVKGQVTGACPTVNIDKTDGCMMYLSEASKEAEIVTAKSSEMNILIPFPDGEFKEFAIVEQFKSKFNGKTLVTTPSDIAG